VDEVRSYLVGDGPRPAAVVRANTECKLPTKRDIDDCLG